MQRKVKLYHYQLPLDCAMIVRGQSVDVREGWIIELHDGCQQSQMTEPGRGEVAPLPGFSQETAQQAVLQLQQIIQQWLRYEQVDLAHCYASVAFGFSMALFELENGCNQDAVLTCQSALLLAADRQIIKNNHTQLSNASLVKLKIAAQSTLQNACDDGEITQHLLQLYPELRLRLDANRRWNLASAVAFAKQIPVVYRQRIDFIEEPCHNVNESLQFSQQTGIAIAWDESLRDVAGAAELVTAATANISAIVIKPMLTGSISYCCELIEQAHNQGLDVVISSSLESSFGLCQLARLALLLTPDTVPGLDTVNVFKQQLVKPWPDCTLPLIPLTQLPVCIFE